jgi:hypothetical protein
METPRLWPAKTVVNETANAYDDTSASKACDTTTTAATKDSAPDTNSVNDLASYAQDSSRWAGWLLLLLLLLLLTGMYRQSVLWNVYGRQGVMDALATVKGA